MGTLERLLRRLWPFSTGDADDEEPAGTVWDAIPDWQYEGRFAEAGGIARGEQERAVSDLQERADRESDVPDHRE